MLSKGIRLQAELLCVCSKCVIYLRFVYLFRSNKYINVFTVFKLSLNNGTIDATVLHAFSKRTLCSVESDMVLVLLYFYLTFLRLKHKDFLYSLSTKFIKFINRHADFSLRVIIFVNRKNTMALDRWIFLNNCYNAAVLLSLERREFEQRLNVVEITRNRELAGPTARQTRHECNLTPRVPRAVYTSPVLTLPVHA